MMEIRNGDGRQSGIIRKGYRPYLLPSPVKFIIALVLGIVVSVALYHVVKGAYISRRPPQFSPSQWVDLEGKDDFSSGGGSGYLTREKSLRVGIAPLFSPEKSIEIYEDFVEYLAEKLALKPVPLYRQTYAEVNDLVCYRLCDIAVVGTYPFIRGEREFGMQALAVPEVANKAACGSLTIVPRSSPASSLLDLRGKRFASSGMVSTTGWLSPALWLTQRGENPNCFFGEHILSGSQDRSVQDVIDGYADGAAVSGLLYRIMTEKDPSITKKTKVLLELPPYALPPVAVHPQMDPALRKRILSALLDMNNSDRGRRILNGLRIDRFVAPEKHQFDALRQAVAKLEGWR